MYIINRYLQRRMALGMRGGEEVKLCFTLSDLITSITI